MAYFYMCIEVNMSEITLQSTCTTRYLYLHHSPALSCSQYLAVAPKIVRVDQTYNVFVSLYSFPYTSLRVRAVLSRDGVEYASNINHFIGVGTKNIQLKVSVCDVVR